MSNPKEYKEVVNRLAEYQAFLYESNLLKSMNTDEIAALDIHFSGIKKVLSDTHNCNARFREKKSNVALRNCSL